MSTGLTQRSPLPGKRDRRRVDEHTVAAAYSARERALPDRRIGGWLLHLGRSRHLLRTRTGEPHPERTVRRYWIYRSPRLGFHHWRPALAGSTIALVARNCLGRAGPARNLQLGVWGDFSRHWRHDRGICLHFIPLDIRRVAAGRGLVGDVAYGHHNANRSVTTDSPKSDDYANN